MGAKTKAASDAVKILYQARQQAMASLAAILAEMPALEGAYKAKAKACDDAYNSASAKVGIIAAHADPTFRKMALETDAATEKLDACWERVKAWVEANGAAYSGMDAALKTLKDKIDKKKTLDFFKTQKSLPAAKTVYDTGVQANNLFKQTVDQAIADYKAWKYN